MAERFGRFTYDQLFNYIREGAYPKGWTKEDKQAMRKRARYFEVKGSNLYYVGGPSKLNTSKA